MNRRKETEVGAAKGMAAALVAAAGSSGRVAVVVVAAGALWFGLRLVAPVSSAGTVADDEEIQFTVVPGATFAQVTDTLVARGLVRRPLLFRIYGRLRKDDRNVRSGAYAILAGTSWKTTLDTLVEGRVRMMPMTIPEGFTLSQIAGRIAAITELPVEQVEHHIARDSAHLTWRLPGPGLEGYLFPDTYHFAQGVSLELVVEVMSDRYRSYWTPERQTRAAGLELSEREVVTLASIIQAEVRVPEEMPTVSAVFHNRLRIGMPLQADPTVLYALGGHRSRLFYAAMDSVETHPYNTYTQGGLPPGPIGAPGAAALDAALNPADVDYFYFVANGDGSHSFSRTLGEHNRRVRARDRDAAEEAPEDCGM